MTIQIAVIDPFVKTPAIHCFNSLSSLLKLPLTYHMPSTMGLASLEEVAHKTDAYIVLGSASHVHENLPWHAPLAHFLVNELHKKRPVLGCCFGHQLLCHAFGSEIGYYYPGEEKLTGHRKVVITKDFWHFHEGELFDLGVTHKQVVKTLGPDLITVGVGLPHDVVIHKNLPFLGTQAHPEASDYFCHEDIKNLSSMEKEIAQRDGRRFIQGFLRSFDLA